MPVTAAMMISPAASVSVRIVVLAVPVVSAGYVGIFIVCSVVW